MHRVTLETGLDAILALPTFYLQIGSIVKKNYFFQLEQDDGTIVGEAQLKVYITNFYFRKLDRVC